MKTKNATYTQGPWRVQGINEPPHDFYPIIGGEGRAIASVITPKHGNLPNVSGVGDARLIAAAPELLAALRMVASNEANMAGCDRITRGMIIAAIAKAEGQEAS